MRESGFMNKMNDEQALVTAPRCNFCGVGESDAVVALNYLNNTTAAICFQCAVGVVHLIAGQAKMRVFKSPMQMEMAIALLEGVEG